MEKRYQVFISSTFKDLENARQEVSQALLRADCFPAGMELFPAADEEQFEFIKKVIDECDYYIIITAGRYGSIHPETGLSYTEMEYDYAVKIGKPVIRLLHKDPFNELRGEFIEKTDSGKASLEAFRQKMTQSKLVQFWGDASELMVETILGLKDIQKRKPAMGWVRSIDGQQGRKVHMNNKTPTKRNKKLSSNDILDFRLPVLEEFLAKFDENRFLGELSCQKVLANIAMHTGLPIYASYLDPDELDANFYRINGEVCDYFGSAILDILVVEGIFKPIANPEHGGYEFTAYGLSVMAKVRTIFYMRTNTPHRSVL